MQIRRRNRCNVILCEHKTRWSMQREALELNIITSTGCNAAKAEVDVKVVQRTIGMLIR